MAAYGFRTTTDIVGLIALSFAFIYFVFGGGMEAIKTTCENYSDEHKEPPTPSYAYDLVSQHKSVSTKFGLLSFRVPVPKSPSIFSKTRSIRGSEAAGKSNFYIHTYN